MENLKGVLIGLFLLMFIAVPTESADNSTLRKRVPLVPDEWPTQVLYDTTIACYQGTVRWIMMANPTLIGQVPPPQIQRVMLEHCFCVLDVIRLQYSFPECVISLQDNPGVMFMSKSYQCINDYGKLPGIAVVTDNETKTDNSTSESLEGSKESPDQKQPDSSKSELIFQG